MFGLSATAVVGIVGATVSAVGMVGSAQTANAQGAASVRGVKEQTKQSKAKQEELNAQSELQRQIQKINNARIMQAADKTYAAAATNLARNRAAMQTSNVMQRTAMAEAAGAYVANVASKSVGGSSVDAIAGTMALRDSLKTQLTKNAQAQADYDAVNTLAGIIPAAWQSQDMTVLSGNQSAAAAVPAVQGGFNWASAIGNSGLLRGLADWLTPSPAPAGGASGTGLKIGGGDVGLSAPKTSWWAPTASSVRLQ